MKKRNQNPFVFVHGMFGWGDAIGINKITPYWGGTTGNLMDFLTNCDYECYAASVGPISSAWDNACELYAQLTGTKVDYGKYHSQTRGHDRYGRTYSKPLFSDFGKRKIHLIGHSHGGQVVRLLAHLLTYGDENEINATDENDISGLFTGGKENWLSSVTTICTPNNGTMLYNVAENLHLIRSMGRTTEFIMGLVGRTFIHGRLIDCQYEQFGLTPLRGEKKADNIITAIKRVRDSEDYILNDLSFKGANELNEKIQISKNVHYFCYTANGCLGENFQTKNMKFPILKMFGHLIANIRFPESQYGITFDESWRENDGLVNTPSGKNPFDEPAKEYDGNLQPGVWNIMPTFIGDHGEMAGLLADKRKFQSFYLNHLKILTETEKEKLNT